MEQEAAMTIYAECEKLAAAVDQSQPAGEFLDWLKTEKGITLVTYEHWTEQDICIYAGCEEGFMYGHKQRPCSHCNGTGKQTYSREGWVPFAHNLEALLAEWLGIDLKKVEEERRAMLRDIRERQRI